MFGTTQEVLGRISQQPINDRLISYTASKASRIIVCEPLPSTPEVPISKAHGQNLSIVEEDACNHDDSDLPGLKNFLATLISDCEVDTYLILIVLVYLSRLRATLTLAERGLPCTPHRIILASLIHAAHYVGYYRTRDRLRNICLGEDSARPLVRFSQEDVTSMEEDLDARLHGDFIASDGILLRKLKEFDEGNNERTEDFALLKLKLNPNPASSAATHSDHVFMHALPKHQFSFRNLKPENQPEDPAIEDIKQGRWLSRYDEMILEIDKNISPHYFLTVGFFSWLLLAGFLVSPSTYASVKESSTLDSSVMNAVRNVPLLYIASFACLFATAGLGWLWWRWGHNYVWVNRYVIV
ncbi:hypothetical protein HJFPF1_13574 [Paramyrothecium foliicola]|nr:hypothetical protein HJFPF1_13574 [Paramyrothecium foliicola]